MHITYFGHSTFTIQQDENTVLFDPFITPNPAASHIKLKDIQPQHILISHCHEDHVADLAKIQKESDAEVICIVEAAPWVAQQGVQKDKITAMNLGGTVKKSFGTAKMVPALHTSSTPDGQYAGVPVGFLLTINGEKIYYAGDTSLTMEMQLLADEAIDLAILPIGGYYTMDVQDAVKAAKLLNCKKVIGVHYNTFPPIQIDKTEAVSLFKKAGVELILLNLGESVSLE